MGIHTRELFRELEPYAWEPSNAQIARKVGLNPNQIRRFDTNTSPYPPEKWLRELSTNLQNFHVNNYPDTSYSELTKSIAKYAKTGTKNLVITNGADEGLDISVKTFIDSGCVGITSVPTYSYFSIVITLMGGKVIGVPRKEGFQDDIEKIISESKKNARMIFLCNPNNPTGNRVERDTVVNILENSECAVVVDEAYFEFSGNSLSNLITKYDNLIIIRTFSKAFSLAGVRVGYIIASENMVEALHKVRPPNSLSTLSLSLAKMALGDIDLMKSWVRDILKEKDRCLNIIRCTDGLETHVTETNFLLIKFNDADPSEIYKKLLEKGLVLRNMTGVPGLEKYLRFSIGLKRDNDSVLDLITKLATNR